MGSLKWKESSVTGNIDDQGAEVNVPLPFPSKQICYVFPQSVNFGEAQGYDCLALLRLGTFLIAALKVDCESSHLRCCHLV